ncbi:MAG: rhomboid family intramembrane serine protease [Beijerinckiaceae bacterium]
MSSVSERQPIFNLPAVIIGLIGAFALVQGARGFLSPELDAWIIATFGFIPARFSQHLDPAGLAASIGPLIAAGEPASTINWLLGDGGWSWWTPLTYAFLHGDWLHLGLNALWLAAFGTAVARRFGAVRFAGLFALASVAGALAHLATHRFGLEPVVGASAGISGAVAAALRFAFEPGAPLGPAALPSTAPDIGPYRGAPLPLSRIIQDRRAMTFLITWFGCNLLFGALARPLGVGDASIAWEAHIGGFLAGLLAFSLFDPPSDPPAASDPPSGPVV